MNIFIVAAVLIAISLLGQMLLALRALERVLRTFNDNYAKIETARAAREVTNRDE